MSFRHYLLALPVIALAACSSDDKPDDTKPPLPAEQLYSDARAHVDANEQKEAIKSFEEVERQYPASPWALNAQVMAAYSNYKIDKYDEAIAGLERFVKLYPDNESTPYAYYLIALCYYEQISDVGRDQKMTQEAMTALREVVRRYPDSEYSRDAKIKLDLTTDHLAGKEMEIGRYYLVRDDALAAINRFRFVVENYQTTSHVPEALHRLVESYLKLGVRDEARKYAAVLGHNFPDSIWYRDSYKLMMKDAPQAEKEQMEKPAGSSWLPF
jgi:outer membrane protein assembly factor BamD